MPVKGTKIKFYTEEEHKYLLPAIQGNQHVSTAYLKEAAKKLNRTPLAILDYVNRKKRAINNPNPTVRKYNRSVTTRKKSSFKQGEFVIPIDKWEVRTLDGVNHLVFKFGKNIK